MSHPNRPNRGVTLVKLAGILLITGVLAAGVLLPVVGGVGLGGKAEADRFLSTDCNLDESPPATKTTLLANDQKTVIAQFFSQNRTPVDLSQIPVPMQQALIDTEDRRFYDHHGVDIRGLLRAAASNSESDGDTQGGSTLTMQYVKQLRYYNATTDAERAAAVDQNVDRKIQDAKCAIDLEKRESKQQILANYFNITFFGENSYGVESAANTYFSKDVKDLTIPEAALIVGLPKDPSLYDPFQNPQQATERRNQVLDNMVTSGNLSQADATKYKATPLGLSATTPPPVAQGCSYTNPNIANAGFFCDYAKGWLEAHGISEETLLRGGLTIVTTLDAGLQTAGQNAVWSGASNVRGGAFAPTSASSLVMPSVDPRTGNVLTMITSRHYTNPNDPNAAADPNQTSVPLFTTAAAGSGSVYKYFTAATALTAGASPTLTLNAGDPYTTKNCPKYYDRGKLTSYVVHNAGKYSAVLPMDKALYESSNTYFVGLEDMFFGCNTQPVAQMAVNLGMSALKDKLASGDLDQQATFTLGQDSTSPLELTEAYATIANDGKYCPSTAVLSVTDSSGKAVPFTKDQCTQVLDPQVARTLIEILEKDTDTQGGTAYSQFGSWYGSGGSHVASKTGTNNATTCDSSGNCYDNGTNSAIWFVGVTPVLTSAAAVFNFASPTQTIKGLPGYSDGYASGDAFGAAAGAYWLKAYGPALKANPWTWATPEDVPGNTVPSVTGKTPADATSILTAAGYKVNILPYTCGSSQRSGTLIGYSPNKAEPGATITACVSNGKAPSGGTVVTKPPTTPTGDTGDGNGNGGGGGGGGGGVTATDGGRPPGR